jgi:hypothetical protein
MRGEVSRSLTKQGKSSVARTIQKIRGCEYLPSRRKNLNLRKNLPLLRRNRKRNQEQRSSLRSSLGARINNHRAGNPFCRLFDAILEHFPLLFVLRFIILGVPGSLDGYYSLVLLLISIRI